MPPPPAPLLPPAPAPAPLGLSSGDLLGDDDRDLLADAVRATEVLLLLLFALAPVLGCLPGLGMANLKKRHAIVIPYTQMRAVQ